MTKITKGQLCHYTYRQNDPATWAHEVGNSWRTTDDIADSWDRYGIQITNHIIKSTKHLKNICT